MTKSNHPSSSLATLAHELNLTPGTVSRALRGTGRVSTATRARVHAAARRLHYVPNEHARRLLGSPSRVIGILTRSAYTATQTDYYMLEFIDAFTTAAAAQSYAVQLVPSTMSGAELRSVLMARVMDGVIIIADASRTAAAIARHLQPYPRVVVSPSRLACNNASCVTINRASGSAAAAEHLLQLGHHRIAMVRGAETRHDEKCAAFLAVCRQARVTIPPDHIVSAGTSIDRAFHATCTLLRRGVTAVFAETDWLALGCLHAAHHLGYSVPRDVSLIGFDDLAFAADLTPPLTTVNVPRAAIALAAFGLIRQLVGGDGHAQHIVVPTGLVRRASTAPPRPAAARRRASHLTTESS